MATLEQSLPELVQQDLVPALRQALVNHGIEPLELQLNLEQQKINVIGFTQEPACWQLIGRWPIGWKQYRQFNIYFLDGSLTGKMAFSYAENSGQASTLEPFLADERKITPNLLVFWLLQRLNGQKWLEKN